MFKFNINDKVKRLVNIYDSLNGYKTGIIIKRYSEHKHKCGSVILGPYPELYSVLWNDGTIENGFLPHGLILV